MKKQSQSFIRPIFHQVFVTSSVTTFTTIGAGFVDTIIVSYFLGVDAIAAAGLGYSFYYLAGIIYGCIATGFKSLASRSLARGDTEDFRHIYSVSISLAVLVSCLVMGLIYCFTGPLVWLLGARGSSESLAGMTSSYLAGLAVGLPALTLNSVLSTALYFDNGTAAVTTANIVSMAADILLDIAAVLTGAGMLGIGLASSVSAWMGLIVLALKSRKSSLLVFTLTKPKKGELREMVHLGSERIFARLISFGARRPATATTRSSVSGA